ncbi:MAG: glycoside hydrolase family 2 TIM barrel-domain containing protein [Anaerohalosphaeraceae bacterium]
MRQKFDLTQLKWTLHGYYPEEWRMGDSAGAGIMLLPEIIIHDVSFPSSVQKILHEHGLLPDWNIGFNSSQCEWVENRHWFFKADLPDNWLGDDKNYKLVCHGIDGFGELWINQQCVYKFNNSYVCHTIDITDALKPSGNVLKIIFCDQPRWLGQMNYTSQITQWKPRFNYRWDWTARLVQIGIWDGIDLEATYDAYLAEAFVFTSADIKSQKGVVDLQINVNQWNSEKLLIELSDSEKSVVYSRTLCKYDLHDNRYSFELNNIKLWWPNGMGPAHLYNLTLSLIDQSGKIVDAIQKRIGFRNITWEQCKGAPANADPWLCVVNGKPVFLAGVNWTPIRPNFADLSSDDYDKRLKTYQEIGFNVLRLWGGAFLEKQCLYDICDERGILVWQEFPLSSSGIENYPPDDDVAIKEMACIAQYFIAARGYHACILAWSGGNELMSSKAGPDPATLAHPMIGAIAQVVRENDPYRRFMPTSPSGPRFVADENEYGQGLHWDVHGPWVPRGRLQDQWTKYWNNDDSLFRSEVGAPGPSSMALMEKYTGDYNLFPPSKENIFWRRFSFWIDHDQFVAETGREPKNIEVYIDWGQNRQALALSIAVSACRKRFPSCGGIILWMGHDSFPCPANTSIIDFEGEPKPAALAIAKILHSCK